MISYALPFVFALILYVRYALRLETLLYAAPLLGIVGFLFALGMFMRIRRMEVLDPEIRRIGSYIKRGAMTFLYSEYRILAIFLVAVFLIIGFAITWPTAIAFFVGGVCSLGTGYIGMMAATEANSRTTEAAVRKGAAEALWTAFQGGSVMGMTVASVGIIGLGVLILILKGVFPPGSVWEDIARTISGFSMGASSVALFARVGGGIYTKAADIGADLVGKTEAGIPEDDPRNPAVIADNVGDNVGDIAGMGADLFESYVGSIVAAIALGALFAVGKSSWVLYPLIVASFGTLASLIGVVSFAGMKQRGPSKALEGSTYVAGVLAMIAALVFSWLFFHHLGPFLAVLSGIVVGIVIGRLTEYYTSGKVVRNIAKQSLTGSATNIISGLGTGMFSSFLPIVAICISIFLSILFINMGDYSGLAKMPGGAALTYSPPQSLLSVYGIALAAVGMLCTVGIVMSVDGYGPIADNAGGLAQQTGQKPEVRSITDKLDAMGNSTAAMGKGFAIGSAALTALALFSAYAQTYGSIHPEHKLVMDILQPDVVIGILLGASMPFLFSSLAIKAVGRAAGRMILEVRRQFKEIDGLLEGRCGVEADYGRCIGISTQAALREMVIPGTLAVAVPILTGFLLGANAVGGLLCGSVASGVALAIFMANAGGAWDNAKKWIEEGNLGGKGSPEHAAAIVGDTVGDPLKDTSGPSMNILLKLMSIVSLVFAGIFPFQGWLFKLME